ncbi:MAG TPA: delta-60 repeat domain-containing protein [Clostridia bacterium]|nr:delta-60 repeat domain-containing protein [Clostridia bacterium]
MYQLNYLTAVLGVAALLCSPLHAQTQNPGTLDSSFNPALGPSFGNGVFSCAIQADGRILIGGDFTTVNGQASRYLARFSNAGEVDTSFTTNPGADSTVRVILEQPDGKILVGGEFTTINGASWRGLARLTSTGTPDSTFGQFSGINGTVHAVALQPDGKILVGGTFSTVNGNARSFLARLNSNGSLDTTFNPLLNGAAMALAVRPDGRILAGGAFDQVNNTARAYLVQLNSNGTTDTTFIGTTDWFVYSLALQTNGQAVVGGFFNYVNGTSQNYIARLNTDGTKDTTFTANSSGVVYKVVLQPNGKIIVGGRFNAINGTAKNNLALLNSNGLLDPNFDTGVGPDYTVRGLALQGDGKIVIGGEFNNVSMLPRTFTARVWGDPPPPTPPADDVRIWTAVEIGWNSQTNVSYQVQWSAEVSPSVWQNFGGPIAGTGNFMSVFDSTRANGKRFYRVIKLQQ